MGQVEIVTKRYGILPPLKTKVDADRLAYALKSGKKLANTQGLRAGEDNIVEKIGFQLYSGLTDSQPASTELIRTLEVVIQERLRRLRK